MNKTLSVGILTFTDTNKHFLISFLFKDDQGTGKKHLPSMHDQEVLTGELL